MSALETYTRGLVRHAWLVLGCVVVATAVVASAMRHLRTEFLVQSSLPAPLTGPRNPASGHPLAYCRPLRQRQHL